MNLKNISQPTFLKFAVYFILAYRFLLTIVIPLIDKTETRYSEIARIMQETGEWVVPQFNYGVPFWAKPPLSTWLSAGSFAIFGVNEMAARLPSFFIAVILIWILAKWAKRAGVSPYLPGFILLTMPEFLIHAGVVSTDSTLLLAITLVMLSFWRAMTEEKKSIWRYLFFVGIGLGLLAKGPIVIVVTGPPIFVWAVLKKQRFIDIFRKLPWIPGLIVTALVAVPWYYFMEQKSPGFIDYFIVGEHFKRYTESGWSGDKYGFAKTQPLGMSWVFLLGFAVPWILIALYWMVKKWKQLKTDAWVMYLLFWLFWTPLFFTISKNAIHTYILPCTVPLALLIMHWWKHQKHWMTAASVFPALCVLGLIALLASGKWYDVLNTDKYLVQNEQRLNSQPEGTVYYWQQITYSGRFYTGGKIIVLDKVAQLDSLFEKEEEVFLMVQKKQLGEIPERIQQQLNSLGTNPKRIMFRYGK